MAQVQGKKNGPQRTNARAMNARQRELKALEMRMGGHPYSAIAKALGYRSRSGAYEAVMRVLDRREQEPAERVRHLELQRLERLLLTYWKRATRKQVPDINAAKLCLDILARRARMLGLDAPVKVDITDLVREVALAAGLDPTALLSEARMVVKNAMKAEA
jgi:hypothetical protein